jgi:hypothetical protein
MVMGANAVSRESLVAKAASRHPRFQPSGHSTAMRGIQHMIRQVAPTDSNVLILGESGTGKELIARHLHEPSSRSAHSFVHRNPFHDAFEPVAVANAVKCQRPRHGTSLGYIYILSKAYSTTVAQSALFATTAKLHRCRSKLHSPRLTERVPAMLSRRSWRTADSDAAAIHDRHGPFAVSHSTSQVRLSQDNQPSGWCVTAIPTINTNVSSAAAKAARWPQGVRARRSVIRPRIM